LSTANLAWLDPGLNPGRRCGKPATNRLSYGAAYIDAFPKYESRIFRIQARHDPSDIARGVR
jgi:hypothetical protein